MIKVTFKNVGQGDSIIVEWQVDSKNKIGIIDCVIKNNVNPTLLYLSKSNYKEVDFIILSHPHYDHFSGMFSLLEFCEKNNIIIRKFLHTCQQIPAYLRVATKSILSKLELHKLFTKVGDLRKKGIITTHTYISDEIRDISINHGITIRFLAPSADEYESFLSKTPIFDEEDGNNNSQANWLSTVIKIGDSDQYALLTSDACRDTLKRVGLIRKDEFKSCTLRFGQAPHHGAKSNHYEAFWKTKNHLPKTPIVFSVGDNIYQHPSHEAVKFFLAGKNKFKIYSTNQVGALKAFQVNTETKIIGAYLDLADIIEIPKSKPQSQYQGDQVFTLD